MEKDHKLRRIRLKCRYEGETRTVTVTPTTEFSELRKRLSNDYGFDVSMKYEDKDGDMIILASQNDLDDIFMYDEAETINVVISETLSLPNLHLKGGMSTSRLGSAPANPVVSLYNTSSVLTSNVQTNPANLSNTTNQSSLSTTNPTYATTAYRSLRPVNGTRLERFPNIGDHVQQGRQQQEMFNIRWKKGEMLGQGAFGVVYLGLNIDTGELMAVKQMATEDVSRRELSSLENEIHLLRNLRHPNIVRYIGTELNPESMSIFLEYVPGGSLKALIDKFGSLEESVARSYTRQLLIGLEYLHRHGIAHRDIKGANCLVGNDGVIKLADFGNSKHWRPITATDTNGANNNAVHASTGDIKGTPSWMAPEVIRDEGGSISWRKADIWSLACTTLEMTTGKAPWKQFNNPVTILYHIACQDTLPEYPSPASFELITFLNTCLQRDPKLRPDITSLLLHPFVAHTMLPPGMNNNNNNNSTNWSGPTNNNSVSNGTGYNNSLSSGSAYNSSMYSNRPSTVSHAVVGEWDRSLPQSLFYSQNSNTTNNSTNNSTNTNVTAPTVNPSISDVINSVTTNDPTNMNHNTNLLLRAEDPELALEVNNDTHMMPINPAAGYSEVMSTSTTPMSMLPAATVNHDLLEANVSNIPTLLTNNSNIPSLQSTPTTTYPKSAYPSRLAALNHVAGSSPSTARTHKRRVPKSTANSTITGGSSPSSRVSSAVKHHNNTSVSVSSTNSTSGSTKRSPKKGIASPVQLHSRYERDVDSPLTVNTDAIVSSHTDINSMNAIGVMEAQLAQLLQQSAKGTENAPPVVEYTIATPIKNAHSTDSVNEDDVVTPPNHNLSTHRAVPKLDIYSSTHAPINLPVSGEKADNIGTPNKKSVTKGRRHSRNRPAFESFDSADATNNHQSAWYDTDDHSARSMHANTKKSIDHTVSKIYNNVNLEGSLGMDTTSRTIHFDHHTIDANTLETSRNMDQSVNLDSSVCHDGDSLTGAGDDDTLCSNEPMLGYSSTEELSHSARSVSKHNYYHNTGTSNNTRGVMKANKINTVPKQQNRLNASKSQTELAEELSIVACNNNFYASGKGIATSVIKPTSLQVVSNGVRRDGRDAGTAAGGSTLGSDSMDTSMQDGLFVYNSLPNSSSMQPNNNLSSNNTTTTSTNALRHSSSRKGLDSAASRHGTRHSTAKTANRLNRSDSNADSTVLDPLDISCDSLDKLHITGTAASKNEGISTKFAEREGTAKHPNTRQSKRGSTANNNNNTQAPTIPPNDISSTTKSLSRSLSNYQDDPRFERVEHSNEAEYPSVSRLFDAPPVALHEHTAAVTRLRAPGRTNLLYSSSLDGTIRIWNNNDGTTESSAVLEATGFKCDNIYGERIERRIVMSATGTNFATNNASSAVDNEAYGMGSTSARTATVRINNLWVDENGENIYAACSDAAVRVWNGGEGKPLRLLRGHEDQITALEGMDNSSSSSVTSGSGGGAGTGMSGGTGSGSGSLIATGSADRTVRVWDVRVKKAQLFAFRGHGDTVLALRWGEGGRSLVSSGKDKTVRIWDTRAGRLRVTLEKHFGSVSCLRILNNNPSNTLHTAYTDALLSTTTNNNNNNTTTTDSTCIVSAGRDSMMNIWSPSGDCIHSQTAHRGTVSFLSEINYAPNSYSAAYQQGAMYGATSNTKATYYAPFSTHPLMISLGTDSMIKLWDMRRFKCIHEINPSLSGIPTGLFTKSVWSELGFIVASNNGLVRLYEHSIGTDNASLSGKSAYRNDLSASIDRSDSHSPGPLPYPTIPSTAHSSQDWTFRDLGVHTTATATGNNTHNTTTSSNSSTINAVTDLLCTETMCASGAKSGQILRWLKAA